jgi:thiamine kinase-like enzyme
MNELDVKKRFKEIFNCENVEVEHRLLGGMSNYTFVVKMNDELYTYRFPGEFAEYFVDRTLEKANIAIMEKINISNETIYLDLETGEKVAKYLPGVSMHRLDTFPYEKVANLLKQIHQSGLQAINDYEPFNRLNNYEQYVIDLGYKHSLAYHETKNHFLQYQDYLASQPKVLCHGDSQPSNFIVDGEKLYAVDFEFCGNNDLIYDIACFANMKLEHGLQLLHVYFDKVDQDKLKRFYLWRAYQALQWFNVAMFKELHGMSVKLHINFKIVSEHYLELAMELMKKIENI